MFIAQTKEWKLLKKKKNVSYYESFISSDLLFISAIHPEL